MFAPFRLIRLLFIGLAACAVTWAMAASALAVSPDPPPAARTSMGDRPAFTYAPGDVKEPAHIARPAFVYAPGDTKSDADRARAVPPPAPAEPTRVTVPADDDTSTVALVLSIAAILTALGAVTLTVTRPGRALGT
jgi:hypothetical protein